MLNRTLSTSGNLVVWADIRNDTPEIRIQEKPPIFNIDIYCYDLSVGKETQITTDPANDSHPSIDNSHIAWSRQFGTTNGDIYFYDIETGQERQISTSGCASRQSQRVNERFYRLGRFASDEGTINNGYLLCRY